MATKNIHEVSNKSINWKLPFVLTSRSCYAEAISLFWVVYEEMETLYEKHRMDHPALQKLQPIVPIFQRASRFRKDILFMMPNELEAKELMERRRCRRKVVDTIASSTSSLSADGKADTSVLQYSPPELQAYVDRLHHVAETNPIQLLAYMYSMYGAITGGGYIISRTVQRAFSLPRDDKLGVQIFDFDFQNTPYQSGKAAWNEFKRILDDDIQLDESDIQLLLEEAPKVFVGNNALVGTVHETLAFQKAMTGVWNLLGKGTAVAVVALTGIVVAMFFSTGPTMFVSHNIKT